MRKVMSTSIEEEIQKKFKAWCAENGLKINDVLEELMIAAIRGETVGDKN